MVPRQPLGGACRIERLPSTELGVLLSAPGLGCTLACRMQELLSDKDDHARSVVAAHMASCEPHVTGDGGNWIATRPAAEEVSLSLVDGFEYSVDRLAQQVAQAQRAAKRVASVLASPQFIDGGELHKRRSAEARGVVQMPNRGRHAPTLLGNWLTSTARVMAVVQCTDLRTRSSGRGSASHPAVRATSIGPNESISARHLGPILDARSEPWEYRFPQFLTSVPPTDRHERPHRRRRSPHRR